MQLEQVTQGYGRTAGVMIGACDSGLASAPRKIWTTLSFVTAGIEVKR